MSCHFLNWFILLNQKDVLFDSLGGELQIFCYNYFINNIIYSNNQVLYQYHDKRRFYISNKIILKCIVNPFCICQILSAILLYIYWVDINLHYWDIIYDWKSPYCYIKENMLTSAYSIKILKK